MQQIDYEDSLIICLSCGKVGHASFTYLKKKKKHTVWNKKEKVTNVVEDTTPCQELLNDVFDDPSKLDPSVDSLGFPSSIGGLVSSPC